MIRSMTGFGSAEGVVGGARVTVEIRSVNHRFFNPAIKLPTPLSRWELEVREALRKDVSRGHVTLTARHERLATMDVAAIDETRFSSYVTRLRDLQERHGLEGPLDIGTVLRLPEVLSTERSEDEGSAPELMPWEGRFKLYRSRPSRSHAAPCSASASSGRKIVSGAPPCRSRASIPIERFRSSVRT